MKSVEEYREYEIIEDADGLIYVKDFFNLGSHQWFDTVEQARYAIDEEYGYGLYDDSGMSEEERHYHNTGTYDPNSPFIDSYDSLGFPRWRPYTDPGDV